MITDPKEYPEWFKEEQKAGKIASEAACRELETKMRDLGEQIERLGGGLSKEEAIQVLEKELAGRLVVQ